MKLQEMLNETENENNYNFENVKKIFENIGKKIFSQTKFKIKISDDIIKKLLSSGVRSDKAVIIHKSSEEIKCPVTGSSLTFNYSAEAGFIDSEPIILIDVSISKASGIFKSLDIELGDAITLEFNN